MVSCAPMTTGKQTPVRFLLAMAGLGGLLYGIDFGTIAAAMPYIRALGLFSDGELSVVVGAVLFGGIVSSLTAGMLAERFGRKRMIVASAALFLAAIPVVCLSGGSFAVMVVGRVLQGMSAGYMSVVMPMYLTETLPPEIRGRGTGVFQFCLGLGLVLAATVGYAIAATFGDALKDLAWKVNFWWTMLPVAVLFFGALRLTESPVWLANRGQKTSDGGQPQTGPSGDSIIRRFDHSIISSRRYVVPFLLAVLVLTFNKTTGMSSITSYSVVIFQKAGFAGSLGNVGDFAIKLTNLLMTLVAAALVDRKGRTFLLKLGTSGIILSLCAAGGVFVAVNQGLLAKGPVAGWCVVGAVLVYIASFSIGPGVVVWLALSELMPNRIRANGMAAGLFINMMVAYLISDVFLQLVERWGYAPVLFMLAGFAFVYFLVALLFLPETKGRTLEEIEAHFAGTPMKEKQ